MTRPKITQPANFIVSVSEFFYELYAGRGLSDGLVPWDDVGMSRKNNDDVEPDLRKRATPWTLVYNVALFLWEARKT